MRSNSASVKSLKVNSVGKRLGRPSLYCSSSSHWKLARKMRLIDQFQIPNNAFSVLRQNCFARVSTSRFRACFLYPAQNEHKRKHSLCIHVYIWEASLYM